MMSTLRPPSHRTIYGSVLAVLLILEFVYASASPWSDGFLELAAFPYPFPFPFLLHFLPILGVVGWVLWRKRQDEGALSVTTGVGYVEPVVRYAAITFGLFAAGYGYVALELFRDTFEGWQPLVLLIWGGVSALVAWLAGVAFALLGAGFFALGKRLRNGRGSSA